MPGGIAIVLVIVVWLFVLAPLLLRGQKPIRKAGEAFDDTRVLYEGGSGELNTTRRTPRVSSADVRVPSEEKDEDLEVVESEDVLIEEPQEGSRWGSMFSRAFGRGGQERVEEPEEIEIVDGDEVRALEPAPAEADSAAEADTGSEEAGEPEEASEDTDTNTYSFDDAYTSPGDLLDPRAAADAPLELVADDTPESVSELVGNEADEPTALTAEEREFAQRRARRGGWDPEASEKLSASRYQRRQRTLIALGVLTVLTLVAGFVWGGWAWVAPALVVALAALYLVALRKQVRAEEALRARRIRQLRRARLGVRHPEEELPLPRQLRRPGAVVLEADDESPDFVHLDTVYAEDVLPAEPDEHTERPRLRVHDGRIAG